MEQIIGHLYADGPKGSTDWLRVFRDNFSVKIEVKKRLTVDSPYEIVYLNTIQFASPQQVLNVVKTLVSRKDLLFKLYGRPLKNFKWITFDGIKFGLNLTLVQEAMKVIKDT